MAVRMQFIKGTWRQGDLRPMTRQMVPWVIASFGVMIDLVNLAVLIRVLAGGQPSPIFFVPVAFYIGAGIMTFRAQAGVPSVLLAVLATCHFLLAGAAGEIVRRRRKRL